MIYIDTSAFVKRYHTEEGSEVVNWVFEEGKKGNKKICISYWVISETVNALDKHFSRGDFTKDELMKVMGSLFYDIFTGIKKGYLTVTEIAPEILTASWDYIIEEHLSAGDALHLVTALYNGCTEFMAADKKLLRIAEKKGFKIINPES